MGASVSTNVSKVVVRALAKASSEIIQNTAISQNSSQIISVRNVEGDVIISGNRLIQRANLNMTALLDALSSEISQQNLATELAQEAKSLTSGLNIGQFSVASNTMDALVEASIDLMSKIGQTCSALSTQSQTIIVESARGSVRIENNVFEQVANIIQSCAENAVSQSQTIQDVSTKLSQSASATSQGLSEWAIAALAAIILGVPIVGGVVGGYVLLKYIFPMGIIAGIVMIILYFYYTDETISMTAYSKFINDTPVCVPTILKSTSSSYANAALAADACVKNAQCVAFDWRGINVMPNGSYTLTNPPETTFYSNVSNTCQASIGKDIVNMVRAPILFSGSGAPTTLPDGSMRGDVYIDLATSNWYQWQTMGFEPKGMILKDRFTDFIVKGTPPTIADRGQPGSFYVYANPINPEYFHVFHYDESSVQKWVQQQRVPGPGMFAIAPPVTNGSGFKIAQKKSWLLYSGIAALVVGGVGTAYVFLKKDDKEIRENKNDTGGTNI